MNKNNYEKLMSLSSLEIRQFFILFIGLDCFINGEELIKMTKSSFLDEMKFDTIYERTFWKPYSFRLKINRAGKSTYLLFRNKDKKYCKYTGEKEIEFFSIDNYRSNLSDSVIGLLIDVCHNNVTKSEGYKSVKSLFELKRNNDFGYRFITGSGINYGYNMPIWSEFEKRFEDTVDNIFGKAISKTINKQVFNNNYGSFQIVKDISYSKYISLIKNMVDASTDPKKSDNSILTAIATALYAQSIKNPNIFQVVATFNYDDLLERALYNSFSEEAISLYKNNFEGVEIHGYSYSVVHLHGYMPKSPDVAFKSNYNSIVLTTDEYFDNYKSPSSFGFFNLYNHLDRICSFIGNSVTDYEEQKVISKHFHDHPSQFHFLYSSMEGIPLEAVMYKTIFLLKIGIIPLWYDSHDEYKNEIYNYAKSILGNKL